MSHHDLIRTSWSAAIADRATLARLFYTKLFTVAPQTRGLFKNDMKAQGVKLVATLGFIIDHLDEPDSLLPAARNLAIQHLDYNVRPEHYAAVGEALVGTLSELLGARFDDATKEAWLTTYQGLANHMISAAYDAA